MSVACLIALHVLQSGGTRLTVPWPPCPSRPFSPQIPQHTTEQHIRTLFAPYGNITDVHVLNKGNAPGTCNANYHLPQREQHAQNIPQPS